MISKKSEIVFSWNIPEKENSKRVKLYKELFGLKIKGKNKNYWYDGIFCKWVNGTRIVDVHHTVLGESLISVPDMEEKYVPSILEKFKKCDVPVRVMRIVENKFFTWGVI